METIQINKKPSKRLRMLLTIGLLVLSSVILSYFIYHSFESTNGTYNINENTIVIMVIGVIVVLPLLLFILPGSSRKEIHKSGFTKKRELVTKRKRKSGYTTINGNYQGKIY